MAIVTDIINFYERPTPNNKRHRFCRECKKRLSMYNLSRYCFVHKDLSIAEREAKEEKQYEQYKKRNRLKKFKKVII